MSLSRVPPARSRSGALDRAVAVLDAVESGARTYTDIVRATGFTRPTTHRILKALEDQGFVAAMGSRGYVLGPRLLRLAATAMRELPLRDLARPALEQLAATTGESAQLYIRSGDARVCIDAVESESELRTIVEIGASLPLTAGSAGKIFLAWTTDADRQRLFDGLELRTDGAPDRDALERHLKTARARGWAASSGERQPGVGSASAPVLGSHGSLIAVVSVSGPASRLGRISASRYAPAVCAAAHQVERALGVGEPA